MISTLEINKSSDFEVNWGEDMLNVTFELYHYVSPGTAKISSDIKEPYIVSEGLTDTIEITAISPAGVITTLKTLELNIVVDQLEGLGCPPNNFVVPNTNSKVSIVGGRKVFALSADELAALINLQASGYFAENKEGFLVLNSETSGEESSLIIGNGKINSVLNLPLGSAATGTNLIVSQDVPPTGMLRVSTGKYVYPGLKFSENLFSADERYFVSYKATDPVTSNEKTKEEDFILIKPNKTKMTISFTR